MGGGAIYADLRAYLGTEGDDPTPDGKVSLEHIECNAGCDYAPVVMVNWEFFDNITPESARELVDGLRSGADVKPTRGAPRLVNWKEAATILAGFPDDQATKGDTAGHPTLAGLRIAKDNGWTPGASPGGRPPGTPAQNGAVQCHPSLRPCPARPGMTPIRLPWPVTAA